MPLTLRPFSVELFTIVVQQIARNHLDLCFGERIELLFRLGEIRSLGSLWLSGEATDSSRPSQLFRHSTEGYSLIRWLTGAIGAIIVALELPVR